MQSSEARRQLGAFIRVHRERLRPPQAGGRRRTPGLRREELADRAGISATWCAWIEQGREVRASPEALARLARALELTRAERAYLFELAGRRDPDAAEAATAEAAPAGLAATVAALPHPAYGLDRLWAPCCWNAAAAELFVGWLERSPPASLLAYVFLEPAARDLIPGWEDRARRLLAEFRADFGRQLADPQARALVAHLRAQSPLFARAWADQSVMDREGGVRRFLHPRRGPLAYDQHTYAPAERPDFKLVVLIPA